MSSYIRGSDKPRNLNIPPESSFAQQVLGEVCGSVTYIEKSKKFVDVKG